MGDLESKIKEVQKINAYFAGCVCSFSAGYMFNAVYEFIQKKEYIAARLFGFGALLPIAYTYIFGREIAKIK